MSAFTDKLLGKVKGWLAQPVEPTSQYGVEADRWDRQSYADTLQQAPALRGMIDKLSVKHDHVAPFVEDVYHAMFKADPRLTPANEMLPTHRPNRTMVEQLQDTEQFKALRTHTRGDEFSSAMATISMREAIESAEAEMAEAKQRAEEAAQAAQEAAEARQAAAQAAAAQAESEQMGPEPDPNGPPTPGQQAAADAAAKADQFDQQAQAAEQAAQEAAESAAANVRSQLRAAADAASQQIEEDNNLASAFGVEDGELQKMDFEERRKLTEQLRNNRLAAFYKLLGQFRMIQQAESRRRIQHAAAEVVGVTFGDDLVRLVPSEWLNFAAPELETLFWKRYMDKELLQFDVRGNEKLGQGAVIVVCDESGSMGAADVAGGTREAWSKALTLALADQAKQKGRDFHYIGFSSSRQQHHIHFPKGQGQLAQVIELTEHFYGGGTNFEQPLRMAAEIMERDYNDGDKPKPDVVFLTDDAYGGLDPDFLEYWQAVKAKTSLRCFGVAIGCEMGQALRVVADDVRQITELASDPRVMADVFRTV